MRNPAPHHSKEDPNQQLLAPKSLDSVAVDVVSVVALLSWVMTSVLGPVDSQGNFLTHGAL